MLNLEECKKILNKGKNKYTQEQIKEIREYLYLIAHLQVEQEGYNNEIKK